MNLNKKPLFKERILSFLSLIHVCCISGILKCGILSWCGGHFCTGIFVYSMNFGILHESLNILKPWYVVFKHSEDSSSHYNICWFKKITIGMSKCFFFYLKEHMLCDLIFPQFVDEDGSLVVYDAVLIRYQHFGEVRYLNLSG
jgi:hypothetical protein